jgi:ankyrin repeat protein
MDMIRFLVTKGADVNAKDKNGQTALINVVYKGHNDAVKMLLDAGAIFDAQDLEGRTALHFAALNGEKAIMRTIADRMTILVKDGGALMRDKSGKTAWQYLKEYGPVPRFGRVTYICTD